MNNIALLARIPIMFALTSVAGIHYLMSNILSLLTLMVLRYFTADRFIWGDGIGSLRSSSPNSASLAKPIDQ